MRPFKKSEFLQRLNKVKHKMAERGIDVLIASHPANMNYLSGYDGWSYYVHQAVIVAAEHEQPIWFGREMDLPGARATAWVDESNLRSYPDEYVDSSAKHPMQAVAGFIAENGWAKKRIGIELDAWYFTGKALQVLQANLPMATWVDAWPLVNWVRLVKSDREIELMRGAGAIVSRAMQVAVEVIKPGVRENDAVADITHAQIAGTEKFWGDYPATLAAVPSGDKSAAPHLTWTGEPFKKNSAVNIELGGCHHRYHAALARTLYLGKPPKKLQSLASVTSEGMHAALQAVQIGLTCADVESAWRQVINKAGYKKHSRIGYSIGLNYPPDWGEQTASLRAGDATVLQPNMCFHLMLGMWMDNWGYELSETIRVSTGGVELLTDFTQALLTKP